MVTAISRRYSEGGIGIEYQVFPSTASRSFVLVHGIGMGKSVMRGLAARLCRFGVVSVIDLPGFGDSPEPSRAGSIQDTGAFVAGFVRSLPERQHVLVGHSMGTQVVVEALLADPGIGSEAVLIAPTVNSEERSAPRQALRMAQDLADENPVVLLRGAVAYAKAGPRWFLAKLRMMLGHDMEAAAARLSQRTLVLRGSEDPVCPERWVRRVAACIPEAEYAEITGMGHEAMIRDPAPAAARILSFLASGAETPAQGS